MIVVVMSFSEDFGAQAFFWNMGKGPAKGPPKGPGRGGETQMKKGVGSLVGDSAQLTASTRKKQSSVA